MKELYPWQSALWKKWVGLHSRLPHALLLKGPQGIGKYDFALKLSQSMLCENPIADGLPCENCSSCHWFLQKSHPDFRLLQPEALSDAEDSGNEDGKKKASNQISVDQIRNLSTFSTLSAHRGGYRVVLIHPAEAMNLNAANALLKMLEEPSEGMLIILVTHKPQQLLPTISSRCLTLAAVMPPPEASLAWLEQQGVDEPMKKLAQSGFAPLQALRVEEDTSASRDFEAMIESLKQPGKLDVYALAERLQRVELAKIVHWMQQWCYDLMTAKLAGNVRYAQGAYDLASEISRNVAILDLVRYQSELITARRESQHPLNPRLFLESLFLSYRQMVTGS